MRRKIFSILLSVAMVMVMMPSMAFADSIDVSEGEESCSHAAAIGSMHYDTLAAAFSASKSGDIIEMLRDFENADLSNGVNFSLKDGVTLDGNNHEIRGNVSVYMYSKENGTSTIKNVVFKYIHNGSMASESDCKWYGWTEKRGTKTPIYGEVMKGTANILNCTFDNADWDAIQMTPWEGATINITGNTFSHSSTVDYSQLRYIHLEARNESGSNIVSNRAANITITDNKFYSTKNTSADAIANIGVWGFAAGSLNVSGNWFESTKNVEISSSSSGNGLAYKIYPARSQADEDIDDLFPAAYYGSTAYNTLQDAINSTSSYVYLMQNNVENVTIPARKNVTIYPKEHEMSGMVTNNGTLTVSSGTNAGGTASIINNGTLSLGCTTATGYYITNNGILKITSGTTYDLSKITGTGKIIISGGTFTTKPEDTMIAESYIANYNEESGTYTVAKMTADQADKAGKKVASSTGSSAYFYNTVEDGIAAGETKLYLRTDYSDTITISEGKSLTLYANGNSMTGAVTNNGTLTLQDPAQVVNNGTLTLKGPAQVDNNGILKITSGATYDLSKITGTGKIIISGGTFATKPEDTMIAESYIANYNEESGTYTVAKMTADQADKAGKKVASSTESSAYFYNTVEDGIAAGKTKLYLRTDYSDAITISEGKSLILYANGNSMTGAVTNNGTLTLQDPAQVVNNGTLTLKGPAQVDNNGILKITSGGTYDLSKITNVEGGIVSISGGIFNAKPDDAWMTIGYCAKANESDDMFTVEKVTMTDDEAVAAGAVAKMASSSTYYKRVQEGIQDGALHLLDNVNENVTKNGMIDLYCDVYTFTGSLRCPGSSLYIDNGTAILNNIECSTFYGGYSADNAKIIVKNGTANSIVVAKNADVIIEGGTYTGSITMTSGGHGSLTITGGTFSSNPTLYVADGYEVTESDSKFTVSKIYVASPTPIEKDPVSNEGTAGTDDATTSADITDKVIISDGKTEAVVDQTTADKIVDKAVANESKEVVIDATTSSSTTSNTVSSAQVGIPTATLEAIAEKTDADVTVKTDVAEVKMDNITAAAVAEQATGDIVQIIAEKVKEDQQEIQFELKVVCSNGTVISDFKGGNVSVTVPVTKNMADKKLVCVYIDDNGIYHKVDGSINEEGTHYTFTTGHFSTYAIMSEEEADAVIKDQTAAAQKAAIKKVKTTVTLSTKEVKKGIRVTVKVPEDQKADKTGIIIYRSTKKDAKPYAVYKKVATKGSTYIIRNYYNVKGNRLVKGKTYYYKARAYKVIDGKTYYGPMSTIKSIKAK